VQGVTLKVSGRTGFVGCEAPGDASKVDPDRNIDPRRAVAAEGLLRIKNEATKAESVIHSFDVAVLISCRNDVAAVAVITLEFDLDEEVDPA